MPLAEEQSGESARVKAKNILAPLGLPCPRLEKLSPTSILVRQYNAHSPFPVRQYDAHSPFPVRQYDAHCPFPVTQYNAHCPLAVRQYNAHSSFPGR